MNEVIKAVKNVLSNKEINYIYLDSFNDDDDLKHLEKENYIVILEYKPISMSEEGYMRIKRGENFKKL